MLPPYVASYSPGFAAGPTSCTPSKPPNMANGDILVIVWQNGGSTANLSVSGGTGSFSLLTSGGSGTMKGGLHYKVITDAVNEPATYSVSGATDNCGAWAVAIRGADTTTPFQTPQVLSTTADTPYVVSSLTPTIDNCMILAWYTADDDISSSGLSTYTTANGFTYTELINATWVLGTDGALGIGFGHQQNAVATGNLSISTNASSGVGKFCGQVAINPLSSNSNFYRIGSHQTDITGTLVADSTPTTVGTEFEVNSVCDLTGYWVYTDSNIVQADYNFATYTVTGVDTGTLLSGSSLGPATPSTKRRTWKRFVLGSPVALTPNQRYVAACHVDPVLDEGWRTQTDDYFDPGGPGATNRISGPLEVPSKANATGNDQGRYNIGASIAFPILSDGHFNWISPEVQSPGATAAVSRIDTVSSLFVSPMAGSTPTPTRINTVSAVPTPSLPVRISPATITSVSQVPQVSLGSRPVAATITTATSLPFGVISTGMRAVPVRVDTFSTLFVAVPVVRPTVATVSSLPSVSIGVGQILSPVSLAVVVSMPLPVIYTQLAPITILSRSAVPFPFVPVPLAIALVMSMQPLWRPWRVAPFRRVRVPLAQYLDRRWEIEPLRKAP